MSHWHTEIQLASSAFSADIKSKLMEPINPSDVEIRPDGTLYLPEIKYRYDMCSRVNNTAALLLMVDIVGVRLGRRVLNQAIGPGGWALVPRGPPSFHKDNVFREFALFCFGKFASQAIGEQQVVEKGMTAITAIEVRISHSDNIQASTDTDTDGVGVGDDDGGGVVVIV
jgi:hypothetical protein